MRPLDLNELWIEINLRLQQLTWLDWLDLLLVAAALFFVLTALGRAHQATFMVRGLGAIGLVLLIVTVLLPLPAFSLLIRIILIFLLVALPVVFQRQLRSLFEDVGRSLGLDRLGRGPVTEDLIQPLVRAVEHMSAQQTGALIVLEGQMNLDEIAQTGVTIDARISSELLNAIFYAENPLHDGALLVRGERALAASCVLPMASGVGVVGSDRRLGTRHRAALRTSERTDALVVVVSEETGTISVAEEGFLEQIADQSALRERLLRITRQRKPVSATGFSLRSLFNGGAGAVQPGSTREAKRVVLRLGGALLFAFILWWFVLSTSNSLPEVTVQNVPLQLDQPAGMVVAGQAPETVDLELRAVEEDQSALDERAFQASLPLAELSPGIHQVPVAVTPRVDVPVQIVEVDPATVEVNLAPLSRRTVSVTVDLADEALLSAAYKVEGEPRSNPAQVEVSGPQPLVEQVAAVRATLSLSNTRGTVESMQPLIGVDEEGNEVKQVALEPAQAEVTVTVARRADMREVPVAIVTTGEPDPAYWVSGLTVQPPTVVLSGSPQLLAIADGAVTTLPVDVTGAAGTVVTDVPLDLPPEVVVKSRDGEILDAVQVTVRVSPHRGDLTVSRTLEVPSSLQDQDVMITPEVVELLLSGPQPILAEIEQRPELVRVVVPTVEVASGESVEQALEVIAPPDVRAQLVTGQVTVSRP